MTQSSARLARFSLPLVALTLVACGGAPAGAADDRSIVTQAATPPAERPAGVPDSADSLVVAGGCFWCTESDFERLPAVYEAESGYAGGKNRDATYRNHEGHREVVRVWYDPAATDYRTLIDYFLRTVDVTDDGGQFCDRGHSYTTAIYTTSEERAATARAAVDAAADALGQPIVTPVEPLPFFVRAEDYHQDYYKSDDRILSRFGYVTKAEAYKGYREGCRRDATLKDVWGDAAKLPQG